MSEAAPEPPVTSPPVTPPRANSDCVEDAMETARGPSGREEGASRPGVRMRGRGGGGRVPNPPADHQPEAPLPEDWRSRIARLGRVGLVVYVLIYVATIAVFYAALLRPEVRGQPWIAEHMGEGSLLVSAWLLAKALMVPRAALTCALTPLLARPLTAVWVRISGRGAG